MKLIFISLVLFLLWVNITNTCNQVSMIHENPNIFIFLPCNDEQKTRCDSRIEICRHFTTSHSDGLNYHNKLELKGPTRTSFYYVLSKVARST